MITILALIRRTIDRVVVIERVFLSCLLLSSVYSFVCVTLSQEGNFRNDTVRGKYVSYHFGEERIEGKLFKILLLFLSFWKS